MKSWYNYDIIITAHTKIAIPGFYHFTGRVAKGKVISEEVSKKFFQSRV